MDTGIVLGRASSVSYVHLDGFMTTGPRQGRMQSERQPVLPQCIGVCIWGASAAASLPVAMPLPSSWDEAGHYLHGSLGCGYHTVAVLILTGIHGVGA